MRLYAEIVFALTMIVLWGFMAWLTLVNADSAVYHTLNFSLGNLF